MIFNERAIFSLVIVIKEIIVRITIEGHALEFSQFIEGQNG